jgi:predicted DNA-binding transcriptional regulator YafY
VGLFYILLTSLIHWKYGMTGSDNIRIGHTIVIDYVNWQNIRTNNRKILPIHLWYGSTKWHKESQWILTAWDYGKQEFRDFALKDVQFV